MPVPVPAPKLKRISDVIAELRLVQERHGDLLVETLVLEYRLDSLADASAGPASRDSSRRDESSRD